MKWYESLEEKRVCLRKKFADGYVSDYYMRTGIPRIFTERAKAASGKPKKRSKYPSEKRAFE